jgi:hypothetical protein
MTTFRNDPIDAPTIPLATAAITLAGAAGSIALRG